MELETFSPVFLGKGLGTSLQPGQLFLKKRTKTAKIILWMHPEITIKRSGERLTEKNDVFSNKCFTLQELKQPYQLEDHLREFVGRAVAKSVSGQSEAKSKIKPHSNFKPSGASFFFLEENSPNPICWVAKVLLISFLVSNLSAGPAVSILRRAL